MLIETVFSGDPLYKELLLEKGKTMVQFSVFGLCLPQDFLVGLCLQESLLNYLLLSCNTTCQDSLMRLELLNVVCCDKDIFYLGLKVLQSTYQP